MKNMESILKILEQRNPFKTKKRVLTAAGVVTGVTAGAVGTVFIAPLLGFTSAGIAAGSIASGMMSSAAIANGGGVAAGSIVAVLQSAGAVGFSAVTTTAVASASGVVGGALGWLAGIHGKKKPSTNPVDANLLAEEDCMDAKSSNIHSNELEK